MDINFKEVGLLDVKTGYLVNEAWINGNNNIFVSIPELEDYTPGMNIKKLTINCHEYERVVLPNGFPRMIHVGFETAEKGKGSLYVEGNEFSSYSVCINDKDFKPAQCGVNLIVNGCPFVAY